MRFACEKCSAKFTIADEKVRGKVVAVKCSKCGNKITVNGKSLLEPEPEIPETKPLEESTRMVSLEALEALRQGAAAPEAPKAAPPPPAPEPAPAPAAADIPGDFYAMVEGAQVGPLSADDFRAQVARAQITDKTYVWRDGMADWLKAGEVDELKPVFAPPPRKPTPKPPAPAPLAEDDNVPTRLATQSPEAKALLEQIRREENDAREPTNPPEQQKPAPAAAAAPAGAGLSDDLFDGDIQPTMTAARPLDIASIVAKDVEKGPKRSLSGEKPAAAAAPAPAAKEHDPFAAVADSPSISKPGEIGEQTRFFIAQSGVNKRNAPWKVALFIGGALGLPVAILYMLSNLHVVPLDITTIDEATGQEVKTSVFSTEGMAGLRDALLGNKKKAQPKPVVADAQQAAKPKPVQAVAKKGDDGAIIQKIEVNTGMSEAEKAKLKLMYEANSNDKPMGTGPKVRLKGDEKVAVDGDGGLSPKVINDTVNKNAKGFQTCVENELRRNPSFKGGKIEITITIGTSGVVTKAAIDKQDIDQSSVGSCLKDKAKRVVFPSFQGEPVDAAFPLVLANGG